MADPLPLSFQPLLWSYDFSSIDPERDKKVVILSAINYGDLLHWKWIVARYGKDTVRQFLMNIPATELRPRAQRLAAILLDIKTFNYAPRGVK